MTELPAPIAKYFAHVNAQNWDGLRRLWTDDAELTSVGGGRPRRGIEDVIAYYPGALASWSEHRDTPVSWSVGDDGAVTVQIRFDGVHKSGTPVSFDAVDIFGLDGDRLSRVEIAYDVDEVRAQLPPVGRS
ncbi:MAG: nuclear transport factor 2 family protein [Microthrixaceae bacterium]